LNWPKILFERNPVPMVVYRASDNRIVAANRAAGKLFGLGEAEFLGRRPFDQIHPSEFEGVRARVGERASGERKYAPILLRKASGETFYAVLSAEAVEYGGEAARLVQICDLLGERPERGGVLRRAAAFDALISNTHDLCASFSRGAYCRFANEVMAVRTGIDAERWIGRRPGDLGIDPAWAADIARAISQVVAERRPVAVDQHARLGGVHVAIDALYVPEFGDAGEVETVHLIGRDVTAHRSREERRVGRAVRQRDILAREIQHRVKNHLQGVMSALSLEALQRPELSAVLQSSIGRIRAIALMYGLQAAHGAARLDEVVATTAESLRQAFSVVLEFGEPEALAGCWLSGEDGVPLAFVVNELLTNAAKHRAEGPVTLAAARRDGCLVLEVANRGALPEGFELGGGRASGIGLELALGMLPPECALALEQRAGAVVATLRVPQALLAPARARAGDPA